MFSRQKRNAALFSASSTCRRPDKGGILSGRNRDPHYPVYVRLSAHCLKVWKCVCVLSVSVSVAVAVFCPCLCLSLCLSLCLYALSSDASVLFFLLACIACVRTVRVGGCAKDRARGIRRQKGLRDFSTHTRTFVSICGDTGDGSYKRDMSVTYKDLVFGTHKKIAVVCILSRASYPPLVQPNCTAYAFVLELPTAPARVE